MVRHSPYSRILCSLVMFHFAAGCSHLDYYDDPHRVYRSYADNGQYEQAIDSLNRELESPTREVPLYILYSDRGELYRWQGQYEKAVADYKKALEFKPDYYIIWNNLGLAYTGMKNYGPAVSCFNKALEINSTFATGYLNRGLVYLRLRENDKAADDFHMAKALGFSPGRPGMRYTD